MKTTTALLLALLLCGSISAEPITLRGVNGNEITAEVVRAGTVSLIVRLPGETNETAVQWKQIDMEYLQANYPEVAKMKSDAEDRAKNGVFSSVRLEGEKATVFPDNRPKSGGPTYRELLNDYTTGSARDAAYKVKYFRGASVGKEILAEIQQLVDQATKAKDPQAATYRRALEKLTQQLNENGVRRDAQEAVADMLKALDKKS
jgi:hypothetical protein